MAKRLSAVKNKCTDIRPNAPVPRQAAKLTVRLSAEVQAEIVAAYLAGEHSTVLARRYGVSKTALLEFLREAGVQLRRQPMTPAQIEQARQLYERGLSLSQVSGQLGIHQDTIRLALKRIGVVLRPGGGSAPGRPPRGSRVHVKGLNNWEADFSLADLLPALRNPRELDTDDGRRAVVPTQRGRYSGTSYYLAPRASRVDAKTREYKAWGEMQGVHQGDLVRSNADGSDWYRQTRNRLTSRWVLPYNSGYDYGAVDNKVGALLNGRFVGVDAKEGVDPELLGAVLNSTVVILMRLLEGVATGNEGAFDVGPPAVRAMRVPDPRKMAGTQAVVAVLDAIRADGRLPPSPDRTGSVAPLRRDLDLAVLVALGTSRGAATVLVDRIYQSYGRWRAAVEDVEDQMQTNRRTLARRGGTRTETPLQRTVRRVWDEIHPTAELLFSGLTPESGFDVVDPVFRTHDHGQGALFGEFTFPTSGGETVDLRDQRRTDLARRVRDYGFSGPFPALLT